MKTRRSRIGVAATVVAAVMVVAAPSVAAVDACARAINAESAKMQSAAFKAFQRCHDAYQKDILKPATPPFSKAAKACEKRLAKLIGTRGTLATSINRLVGQVPKTCADADLFSLGHLPSHDFGSRWAQFQAVAAIQLAYEQMLGAMRQWSGILTTVGETGSCPTCERLSQPPCYELSCRLTASKVSVSMVGLTPDLDVPLSGALVLKLCDASPLLSAADDVRFVLAPPGQTFDPAPVEGIATMCLTTLAGEGVIQCGSGARRVDCTQCVDHDTGGVTNAAGAPMSGDCAGWCEASHLDTQDSTVVNGGRCSEISVTAGGMGDAVILLSVRNSWELGGDCRNPGVYWNVPLSDQLVITTGAAMGKVMHADGNSDAVIERGPQSGAAFDCATIRAGFSPGVRLVGVSPAVHSFGGFGPPGPQTHLLGFGADAAFTFGSSDAVFTFGLQCE